VETAKPAFFVSEIKSAALPNRKGTLEEKHWLAEVKFG
jgi:hypothetical protein